MTYVMDKKFLEELRQKYVDNPPDGMTPKLVKTMTDSDLLDMHYFLTEDDDFEEDELEEYSVNEKTMSSTEKAKEKKLKAALEPEKPTVILKIGDRVRMKDGKSIGTIDKIEKNKAVVNYGIFTSKVSIEELEYVQVK